jgi:N,N'-diacetyllegionaminate synthase
MNFAINKRQIGDGHPCYITLEAGPTHNGLESAKRLAKLAAQAGADAIKFQIIDPDRLVADRKMLFSYEVLVDRETGASEEVKEPLYDLLKRRTLSKEEWRALKRYCDELDLAFFATVGFDDEIALLQELGCHSIKIASGDVTHIPFIRKAARTGMCIQLDTGNGTLGEIEAAVDAIRAEGNDKIIIHQCPSGYPARLESINLRMISTLRQLFPYPIAFSDHTPGGEMDVAAVALGAKLVEKTITEDRTTRSVEHIFSLEPRDMVTFVRTIRDVETALGDSRRIFTPEHDRKRFAVRRSIHVKRALAAGSRLTEEDIEYRRPGYGIPPFEVSRVVGKTLRVAKAAGDPVDYSDLSG